MAESFLGRIGEHLKDRIAAIPGEAWETLTDKVLPQGAAELAQALNTGSGYVAYGDAQRPLDVQDQQPEASGVHAAEQPAVQQDEPLRGVSQQAPAQGIEQEPPLRGMSQQAPDQAQDTEPPLRGFAAGVQQGREQDTGLER